jgi:hypothetical protein
MSKKWLPQPPFWTILESVFLVHIPNATYRCKVPSLIFCYLHSLSRSCLDREQSPGLDLLRLREHSGSTNGSEKRSSLHFDDISGQSIERQTDLEMPENMFTSGSRIK